MLSQFLTVRCGGLQPRTAEISMVTSQHTANGPQNKVLTRLWPRDCHHTVSPRTVRKLLCNAMYYDEDRAYPINNFKYPLFLFPRIRVNVKKVLAAQSSLTLQNRGLPNKDGCGYNLYPFSSRFSDMSNEGIN